MPVKVLTATIANGAQLSGALDFEMYRLAALEFGTMTGTAMTFTAASASDGTYVDVYDDAGTQVSITIASDTVVGISDAAGALAALRHVKLKSGSAEGAARTVTVILRA